MVGRAIRGLVPVAIVAAVLFGSWLIPLRSPAFQLTATCGYGGYGYGGSPAVSGVSPATGPAGGNTTVTVTGCGFTGATAVHFGSASASYTVKSDTSITAHSPSGTAGSTVDVTVTTPSGTSPAQASDEFTYTIQATYASRIDTSTFPTTWIEGVSQTFSVTVTNVGVGTWPHSGANPVELDMHFANFAGGSTQIWLTNNAFPLPADVAPGGSATVSVTVTPNFFGHVFLEGEMFVSGAFWFDQATPNPHQWADPFVYVAPAVNQATIDTSTFPTTWVKGVPQTFLVTVHNTGNVTWSHSGSHPIGLGIHFANFAGGSTQVWLTNNAFALPTDVAPGGSAVVSVTVTPNFFGHVYLEGEMFKSGAFWFDQTRFSNATTTQFFAVFVLVSAT